MSSKYSENNFQSVRTDDMQDIITAEPSWLLRWGVTLFFGVLILILSLSALIRYPDIVNAPLKIYSPDAAKPVVAKVTGKLVKLLVHENDHVETGQLIGYVESTADHAEVISMLAALKDLQQLMLINKPLVSSFFIQATRARLGELQVSYQTFFQAYLSYRSSIDNGFLIRKRTYLQHDLTELTKQRIQLNAEKEIQQRDLDLAEDEYSMHRKLKDQKVETMAEFRQQESKYLSKKSPLIQTDGALIAAGTNYLAKQKEILELDNQISEEKLRFSQALNSLVSQAQDWESKYILTASQSGALTFAGIVQVNQLLTPGQEIFYINPRNKDFFGELSIAQNNLGKVKEGQRVLIKLRSYPFEEYGMLQGRIENIADIPYRDSVFISKVDFSFDRSSDRTKPIFLKQGMLADAEIITQDATLLQRFRRALIKVINPK